MAQLKFIIRPENVGGGENILRDNEFKRVARELEEHLIKFDFGESIKEYRHILKIIPENYYTQFFKYERKYSPVKKRLLISPLIKDFNAYVNADENITKNILKESIVEEIDKLHDLKGLKNFAIKKFKEAILSCSCWQ